MADPTIERIGATIIVSGRSAVSRRKAREIVDMIEALIAEPVIEAGQAEKHRPDPER